MAMAAMLFYLPQPCSVTPRLFQTTRFADFTTAKRAFTSQLARPRATAPMLQKNATGWWFHQPHNIWESIWIISIPNRYQGFNAYREEKWLYVIFIYIYTPSYTPRSNMWLDTCFLTTRNHHFSNCSPTRVKFRLCVLRSHSAWVRAPFGAFPCRIWWGAAIGAWVHRRRCGDLECWGWPGQLLRLLPHKGIQM